MPPAADGAEAGDDGEEGEAELSQYEQERNARIIANRQLLIDLGLASVVRCASPP